jgi:YhcH/YjgK/YiaL family protein
MILDTLSNAGRYTALHGLFVEAFDTLRRKDLDSLAPGRHPVLDDRMYLVIARSQGLHAEEGRLEAHRRYIDIQYVIGGKDTIGWKHTSDCSRVDQAYDTVKDIEFYHDRPVLWTPVMPGMFTIFFPEDAHAPMVGEGIIHKAVMKVAI